MLAAPELVVAEPVEVRDEIDVALELQHGMLAEWVVGRQECAELDLAHFASSGVTFASCGATISMTFWGTTRQDEARAGEGSHPLRMSCF